MSHGPIDENVDLQPISEDLETLLTSLCYYALNNAVPSSQGTDMYRRLSFIQKRLALQTIQLTSFIPLINLIISNATDVEIWNEVTQLVNTHEPIQSAEANMTTGQHGDAYHRRCSAPLEGPDQIMGTLKEALRTELAGTIFENVRGFYKKYFEGPKWANHCEEIAKHYKNRPDKEAFKFPKNPTEKNVWEWIKSIQNEFIEPYRPDESCKNKEDFSLRADSFQTTGPNQIKSGLAIRQIDIFIKSREKASKAHDWRDVLVLGELTEISTGQWVDKFLQLSVYMREVFSAQPLRQFAHGFLMFGTQLQLWVYDRSGPYSAEYIEIRESPEKLVYVLAAYMLMSDEEHGLDSILQREKGRLSVTIYDADTKKARKIYLRSKPLVKQMAIVSRGTTVYISSDAKFVVKISWRAVGRLSEVELLMRAREVKGVASLIGSRNYKTISDLRSGLTFTEEMNRDIHPLELKMTTAGNSLQSGSSNPDGNVKFNEGVKRDSESVAGNDKIILRRSKRSCVLSISRQAMHNASKARVRKNGKSTGSRKRPVSRTIPNPATANDNHVAQDLTPETSSVSINLPAESSFSLAEWTNSSLGKRARNADDNDSEVQTVSEPDMKRLCISSNFVESLSEAVAEPVFNQVTNEPSGPAVQAGNIAESIRAASNADIIMADDSTVYRNRWETVIAAKPFGRAIDEKTTPLELICGLRDAIKGHQSLYMDTKILHRDISINNIILTDPKRNDGCHGVLIDLDLAISLADDNCSESSKTLTGTMEFMAVGLLHQYAYGKKNGCFNTYRHDLESFFFVLISVCIRFGWGSEKSPHLGMLRKWYKGEAVDMYFCKLGAISNASFKTNTVDVFSTKFSCLKELASTLQKILFDRTNGPWLGTDPCPQNLYNPILKAFDDEIEKLKSA
ncbi:unnamed protein product [Blumeria hordei]|uniref:non-specific serine/threonine protein kinase n=1 Tax=Blumeria hordei TaxID=2867405 RepID=A0A383V0L5_BLUHO|nr:unnamed protein product [Blumeria hordei]